MWTFRVAELPAAGVVVPVLVDRPQLVGRQHLAQALDRRHRRTGAGLGVEAVGPAATGVLQPVARRHPLVGPQHLDSARPGQLGWFLRRRRDDRVGPAHRFRHLQVALLDRGRRRPVAGVDPDEHAGAAAQPVQLITLRLGGDDPVLRFPPVPLLPVVAAAPAGHDQDAVAVGEIEEVVVLQLALQPDGVEAHVQHVAELVLLPAAVDPHHHVRGPAAPADQDVLAVDAEDQALVGVQLDFTSRMPKGVRGRVGDLAP